MAEPFDPILDFYRRNAYYQDRVPAYLGMGGLGGGGASGLWGDPPTLDIGGAATQHLDLLDELLRAERERTAGGMPTYDSPPGIGVRDGEGRTAMGGTKRFGRPDESDMWPEAEKRQAMSAEFTGYASPLDEWLHGQSREFSDTPLGQDVESIKRQLSEFSGVEVPFAPGPGLEALGIRQRSGERGVAAGPEELQPRQDTGTLEELFPPREPLGPQPPTQMDQVQKLKELAEQANADELASLVGDMPADKLWDIRAQARQRSRQGSLKYGKDPSAEDYALSKEPTGGGLTYAEMTPELQQRLDDNEAWASGQSIRDAEFALTPGQSQRDPRAAALASDRLADLQQQQTLDRKIANEEMLLKSIAGGGLIPYELGQQLRVGGMTVPAGMIDSSPMETDMFFEAMIEDGGKDLMRFDPLQRQGDPTARWTAEAIDLARTYQMRARQPGAIKRQLMLQYQMEAAALARKYGLERQAGAAEMMAKMEAAGE
jgi:hypothetical protein